MTDENLLTLDDNKPFIEIRTHEGEVVRMPNKMKASSGKTYAEIEKYYAEVSELYLKGSHYSVISDYMTEKYGKGFSIATICIMVKNILKRWQNIYIDNINTVMVSELEKLNRLESEYWDGWSRSLLDKEIIEEFRVVGKDGKMDAQTGEVVEDTDAETQEGGGKGGRKTMRKKGAFSREKWFKRTEGSYGDVKFLEGIERCIEKRCKILGLFQDPSKTININWREEARREGYDPQQIIDIMAQDIINQAPDAAKETKQLQEGGNNG